MGPQVLVQDRGRFGYAHLGVPRAGALDGPAAALANRLVGNGPDAAVLEVLLGGLAVSATDACWVAVTGARAPARIAGVAVAHGQPVRLPAGAELTLGAPAIGMRSYLAVGGGIAVAPLLGSRATDTLAGVGPAPVAVGDRLPIGPAVGVPAALDTPRPPSAGAVRLLPGPHPAWFAADVLDRLAEAAWTAAAASDRVGLRLEGAVLDRRSGELPSEGMVLGAVQVPPDGRPVVLLADHGPTGGYPVAAVIHPDDLWQLAQVRPGERVTLRVAGPATG
ncbi:biotin-dependent carboxyltransferase family protein [Nocardioides sp. BP30]|uniref:5-oxoprolinase subunit C family protein n=1 Tax=Nocardioides sp. BP30 TaxID=3036374 RepID=UPI002468411E|nr:biotin-dependent carboxyltransferase family protein [Nocardioides sp. BP30]WGL53927.1 biotin-dependent carboxyltransferase family protein [Nocardioides sp. BP30]